MIGSDTAGDDAERRTPPPCRPGRTPVSALRAPDPPPSLWRDPPARARPTVAAPPRRRPARPRPVVVDVLAAAAGIGLGLTIGLAVTAESAGSLGAPGGIATALGRLAGLLAAYAMVVVVLLVARVPPLERAIGQDRLVRLAPQARAVAALPPARPRRADHGRLRPARRTTASLHQLGQLLWTYPGILAATAGVALLFAAGITLLPARAPADGLRDVVVGAPLHLPRAVPVVLAPGRHGRLVRRASRRPRRGGPRCGSGRSAVVVAARIGLPVWRSLRHRVRVVGVDAGGPGRRLDRPARAAAWTGCRSPAASSCSGASCAAGCGGRRTRTRSRRRPTGDLLRITVKDLGDHSAGLARLRAGDARGDRGPLRHLHRRRRRARPAAARRRRRRHRADPRAAAGAAAGHRRHRPAARLDARGPRPARRGRRPRSGGAAAGWSSSSARATQVRLDAARPARARPRRARAARSTSAAPTPCRAGSPPSSSAPACPRRRIHFESFTF